MRYIFTISRQPFCCSRKLNAYAPYPQSNALSAFSLLARPLPSRSCATFCDTVMGPCRQFVVLRNQSGKLRPRLFGCQPSGRLPELCSCRRPGGGGRFGVLPTLRLFRFAGHDAHGCWFCDLYSPRLVSREMSASLTSHPSIGKGEERSAFSRGRTARNRVVFINSRRGCGAEGETLGIRTSLTWPYVRVQPAASPAKIERRPSGVSC